MERMVERAYAKINLTLDVLGLRPDKYHDLKSVMQTVSLCDDVEICIGPGEPWKLVCDKDGIPCDERNLAWKAAAAYCKATGWEPKGMEIRITKRIPSGAGMGGGSADAAAVLRLLNKLNGCPMSDAALADLGAAIGSDVPFCVIGGTMMCEGRGEIMRPVVPMPNCNIVICKPEFSVSTPVLYRKLDETPVLIRPDNDAMENALARGDLHQICASIGNVFEAVVAAEHPEIAHIKEICFKHGAIAAQMTGSGSVVFAVMPGEESAVDACKELLQSYAVAAVVQPV